ncbi:MAG: o-succinylbenzoate synthase [Acidimicrobiales bacterium]
MRDLFPSGPLQRIELIRVCVPLVAPLVSAHGAEHDRWSILVRVIGGDDAEGWGECPALAAPTYTSEWHAGAWSVLLDHLGPAALAGRPAGIRGHPMAASAIEGALVDLELRRRGISLADALGATQQRVATCAVLGVGTDIDRLLAEVRQRLDAGVRAVKLKVAPGWDADPLRAVREAWPDLWLAADANGSFGDAAPAELAWVDELGLAYLEQPLAPDELVASARLADRMRTPIALDESATSVGMVETALALGPFGGVNLKPSRLGGLVACADVHAMLVERDVAMWCGGMLELGIGRAAALAVAALPGCRLPTDLGPSAAYVLDDVTDPIVAEPDGMLSVPDGPGIGRVPDPGRLDEVTVARRSIGG